MFALWLDNLDDCYLRVCGSKEYYFSDRGKRALFVDRVTAEQFIDNVCWVNGETFRKRIMIVDCGYELIRSSSIGSLNMSGWYSDNSLSDID